MATFTLEWLDMREIKVSWLEGNLYVLESVEFMYNID